MPFAYGFEIKTSNDHWDLICEYALGISFEDQKLPMLCCLLSYKELNIRSSAGLRSSSLMGHRDVIRTRTVCDQGLPKMIIL
jgi:hypothetical protein